VAGLVGLSAFRLSLPDGWRRWIKNMPAPVKPAYRS